MNTDKAKAQSIFTSAVEEHAPDQWETFLGHACGDDVALRRRVEILLKAHQGDDSFLDRGNIEAAGVTVDRQLAEGPGTVIGPYKLLQQIGEGGFGAVFLAEQERPVRRRVALKVIKPGMDTRQVIARFEAERQALAMMDHPNIAKVLDAGTTGARSREHGAESPEEFLLQAGYPLGGSPLSASSGRPYFVMELVQGVPITEYCDQCNLTTRERLELFVTVCQAVQHAHQKGIIHRDIKPTNVLVAMQDGRPTPKIIDFGVAKAIGQQLTEHTLTTAFAQMVGTPLYMSPEQAELSPMGVDTRSDIYSLGVLLYELLTGATPFDKERLHSASYDELRRIIREEEPPRPSARISTLAADVATTVAERRHTDTRRLRQTVHGDLDWIVMKCLEKDRSRRYDSAGSLARDIERYLHDEPVQACPPSTIYRVRKYARRNKVVLAFVALLVAGFVFQVFSNLATKRERDAKTAALARAQAVSNLLQEMLASSNPDQVKGSRYMVRELLDDFSASLDYQPVGEAEVEADVRSVIGKSYWRLGVYDLAELHSKKALDLRRQVLGDNDERVADSLVDYAWSLVEQSRHKEAERHVRDALSIYRKHHSDPRATVRALWSLQQILMRQSRLAEAEQVANDALALAGDGKDSGYAELPNIFHALAELKSTQGKHEEAEKWAQRSVAMHRRLHGDRHPETAWGLYNLGRALSGQQKFADAEPPLRESLDIFRGYYTSEHNSIQGVSQELKSVLEAKGDSAGVDALTREEIEQASRSDSPGYHIRLAGLLLSNNSQGSAANDVAHQLIRRAIEEYGEVAVDYADDLNRRLKAAEGYVRVGELCAVQPDFAGELDEAYHQLMKELQNLLAAFPNSNECQWRCAKIYRGWADAVYPTGVYPAQEEHTCREAIKLFERQTPSSADSRQTWLYLASTYTSLGDALLREGRSDECEAPVRRGLDIYDEHAAEFEGLPVAEFEFALNYAWLAYFLATTHRQEEANDALRKANEHLAHAAQRGLAPASHSNTLYYLAIARLRLGDEAGYREACAATLHLPTGNANDKYGRLGLWCLGPHTGEDLSVQLEQAGELAANNSFDSFGHPYIHHWLLGGVLYRAGQYKQAAQHLNESIAAHRDHPLHAVSTPLDRQLLLAMTKWQQGQRDEARRLLAEIQPALDEWLHRPSVIWSRRMALEVLRREAEALIEPNKSDEAVERQNRTGNGAVQ